MIPAISCTNEELSCSLGLTDAGDLLLSRDNSPWIPFDFNTQYTGYYPSCHFTAIACCGGLLYAAAVADDGLPWVFTSLMGGVWEPVNLIAVSVEGGNIRATGTVVRILYDSGANQVFLICNNGELVTLTDCPRCVKIKRVADKPVEDGHFDPDSNEIVLHCRDGSECRIPLREAVQYRASIDFIAKQLEQGGFLVDVRDYYSSAEDPIANSVSIPLEELPEWLENIPHDTVLAFICQKGTRSDKAAEYARRKGFRRAYSTQGDGSSVF